MVLSSDEKSQSQKKTQLQHLMEVTATDTTEDGLSNVPSTEEQNPRRDVQGDAVAKEIPNVALCEIPDVRTEKEMPAIDQQKRDEICSEQSHNSGAECKYSQKVANTDRNGNLKHWEVREIYLQAEQTEADNAENEPENAYIRQEVRRITIGSLLA